MTADSRAQAQTEYTYGQAAFERGQYRQAVGHFETAVGLAKAATPLGGEIQIWLVNAYNAVGRSREAEGLCETLTRHPDLEVRKQAKNLLYILQAPQLRRPGNWMSQIPDLATLEDGDRFSGRGSTTMAPRPPKRNAQPEPPPLDPSQINSRDNGFLWLALGLVGLGLGGLLWLS
jgi:tetratricopeptide (TPR) repeat protein